MKVKFLGAMFITGLEPTEDGTYLVITNDYIESMHYTVEWGWNTHAHSHEYAIDSKNIKAWARINVSSFDALLETGVDIKDLVSYNLEKLEEG